MSNIELVEPNISHRASFLDAVKASVDDHHPWVFPPDSVEAYESYLEKLSKPNELGFLVALSGGIVGVVNVSEIVTGQFCSGYLGYYLFSPHFGHGYMGVALAKVLDKCFDHLGLNRLESNIQPGNSRSIRLVKTLGFRKEGYSERYLRIDGGWRDHERWAIHCREWRRRT